MEYIGFFISFLAMVYLFFKQQAVESKRQEYPERRSDEESVADDSMVEFMRAMGGDDFPKVVLKRAPPPPPKQSKGIRKGTVSKPEQYRLDSPIEKRQLTSALEKRQMRPSFKTPMEELTPQSLLSPLHPSDAIIVEPSRAAVALGRLAHRRDLMIYHEVISKPKSMRHF